MGANDHYCYSPNTKPCSNIYCDKCVYGFENPRVCIMNNDPEMEFDIVTSEILFCQDCLQLIRDHLANHH